jgi:hypothetical protein
MVTVAAPTVALLEAVKVTVLVPVAETGVKLAATPDGNGLALRATLPVNPPKRVTVTVLDPLPPCATETLGGLTDSEKS